MTGDNPDKYTLGLQRRGNPQSAWKRSVEAIHTSGAPCFGIECRFFKGFVAVRDGSGRSDIGPAAVQPAGPCRSDIQCLQHTGALGAVPHFTEMLLQWRLAGAITAGSPPLRAICLGQEQVTADVVEQVG
jgi:hypothetical protein